MTLTRCTSEHDGEQVDSHCYGIEDRQGLQSIGYWVPLQKNNSKVREAILKRQQEVGCLIRWQQKLYSSKSQNTK